MRCLITNYLMFYVDLFSCSFSISCQTWSTAYTYDYSFAPLAWFIRHNFINLINIQLQFLDRGQGWRLLQDPLRATNNFWLPPPPFKQFYLRFPPRFKHLSLLPPPPHLPTLPLHKKFDYTLAPSSCVLQECF